MPLSGFQLHHRLCSCCFLVGALWGLEHGYFWGVWRGNQGGSLRGVTAKEMSPPGRLWEGSPQGESAGCSGSKCPDILPGGLPRAWGCCGLKSHLRFPLSEQDGFPELFSTCSRAHVSAEGVMDSLHVEFLPTPVKFFRLFLFPVLSLLSISSPMLQPWTHPQLQVPALGGEAGSLGQSWMWGSSHLRQYHDCCCALLTEHCSQGKFLACSSWLLHSHPQQLCVCFLAFICAKMLCLKWALISTSFSEKEWLQNKPRVISLPLRPGDILAFRSSSINFKP